MVKENEHLEIERKWLCNRFIDDVTPFAEYTITQTYIQIAGLNEARLIEKMRIVDGKHLKPTHSLTYKKSGDLSRIEVQIEIPATDYVKLKDHFGIPGATLHKNYKRFYDTRFKDQHKYIIEMSSVNNSFMYAEVEFESEEEAMHYKAPHWFGLEVTNSDYWKMKNIAQLFADSVGQVQPCTL